MPVFLPNKFSVCLDTPHMLELRQVYCWTPPPKMALELAKSDGWILQLHLKQAWKTEHRVHLSTNFLLQILKNVGCTWKTQGKKMKNINQYKALKYMFQIPTWSIFHLDCGWSQECIKYCHELRALTDNWVIRMWNFKGISVQKLWAQMLVSLAFNRKCR